MVAPMYLFTTVPLPPMDTRVYKKAMLSNLKSFRVRRDPKPQT